MAHSSGLQMAAPSPETVSCQLCSQLFPLLDTIARTPVTGCLKVVVFPHTSLQLELAACVFEHNVLLKLATKIKLPWQTGVILTPFDSRILYHSQYPGINQDPLNCVEVVFFRWSHLGNDNNLHGGAYNKMSQLKRCPHFRWC